MEESFFVGNEAFLAPLIGKGITARPPDARMPHEWRTYVAFEGLSHVRVMPIEPIGGHLTFDFEVLSPTKSRRLFVPLLHAQHQGVDHSAQSPLTCSDAGARAL